MSGLLEWATRKVPSKAVAAVLDAVEELHDSGSDVTTSPLRSVHLYLHLHLDRDVFNDPRNEAARELADSQVRRVLKNLPRHARTNGNPGHRIASANAGLMPHPSCAAEALLRVPSVQTSRASRNDRTLPVVPQSPAPPSFRLRRRRSATRGRRSLSSAAIQLYDRGATSSLSVSGPAPSTPIVPRSRVFAAPSYKLERGPASTAFPSPPLLRLITISPVASPSPSPPQTSYSPRPP